MKKLNTFVKTVMAIAIIIVCRHNVQLQAQPYQSIFGDSIAQFNVIIPFMSLKTIKSGEDLGEGYTNYSIIRKGNDTLINGYIYQMPENNGLTPGFNEDNGYIREDTVSGKIYIYIIIIPMKNT